MTEENKKTLIIEGKEVEFTDEPNLLEVIRKAGMNVPTFCYRPDLTSFGACRMCVVEVEYPNGRKIINSSCTMPPEANIKVYLNTEKVRRIRKTVLELLLANHDRKCLTCDKSGDCELQKYAEEYNIRDIRFPDKAEKEYLPIDDSSPSFVRDPNKCILCGACVRACIRRVPPAGIAAPDSLRGRSSWHGSPCLLSAKQYHRFPRLSTPPAEKTEKSLTPARGSANARCVSG